MGILEILGIRKELREPNALEVELIKLTESNDINTALEAVEELKGRYAIGIATALIKATKYQSTSISMKRQSSDVRQRAVNILSRWRGERIDIALAQAIGDSDKNVRDTARFSINYNI